MPKNEIPFDDPTIEMEMVAHGVKAPIRKETKTLNIKFAVDDANDIVLKIADPKNTINEDDYSLATLKTEYKKFTDIVASAKSSSEYLEDGYWVTKGGAEIGEIVEASVVTTVVVTEQIK